MRKILLILSALALAFSVMVGTGGDSTVDAHSWEAAGKPSPYAWCTWLLARDGWTEYNNYQYVAANMVHYGDAHVYQCRSYSYTTLWDYQYVCFQEVEWYGWQGYHWWYPRINGVGCGV